MAFIQADFKSVSLQRSIQFNAIIPTDHMTPQYAPAALPLKTLYLLHGYAGSAASWLYGAELAELSAQYGLAIVMPEGENHFFVDNVSRQDMYGELIGRELIEYTRRMFPLSGVPEDTIIGGVAMGGYGALRNGLKYSDVFGHIIAVSPAIVLQEFHGASEGLTTHSLYESVFGDLNEAARSDVDLHWLVNTLHGEGGKFPDIYIACGYNDMLVYESRRLSAHLDSLGIAHAYEEGHGTHDTAFINVYLRRALDRFNLDRPQKLPNPFWIDH